jgi:CMP-N,N'-diacetyllegionaminic acid synthase
MNIICIIPARGGSKGVPRKNIKMLNGKPLLQYSIEQASQTAAINCVYVSTDDDEIKTYAQQSGAKVIVRPESLSGDIATSESALIHVLDELNEPVDYIVFLQCTSPIREPQDIQKAIQLLLQEEADSLLSVVHDHSFLWKEEYGQGVSVNYDYMARPRRQNMSLQYRENGSIYIVKPEILRKYNNRLGGKIALYQMADDSAVDIDTEHDLLIAETILKRKQVR